MYSILYRVGASRRGECKHWNINSPEGVIRLKKQNYIQKKQTNTQGRVVEGFVSWNLDTGLKSLLPQL